MESYENRQRLRGTTPPLIDILRTVVSAWHWYVLSIVVCFGAGYIYTKSAEHRYTSDAVILIKSETGKESLNSEAAIFSDMGIGSSIGSLENEILLLTSSSLMLEVISRLNLTESYRVKPLLRWADIYGSSPIRVQWIEPPMEEYMRFTVSNIEGQEYTIVRDDQQDIKAKLEEVVEIEGAKFRILATEHFGNGFTPYDVEITYREPMSCVSSINDNLIIARTDRVTGGVKMQLVDNNSQRARDILNTLIQVYNETIIANKNRVAQNTERFIAERVAMMYQQLGGVDGRLEEIKRDNNLIDFSSVTSSAYTQLSKYQQELESLELQIKLIESIQEQIKHSDNTTYQEVGINKTIVDFGLSEQLSHYNTLTRRYAILLDNSGNNNPVLTNLRNEINTNIANTNIALTTLLANLRLSMAQIQALQSEVTRQISSLPEKEKVVRDVTREQSIKEQLYLYLLNKREANALQLAITESNATVIESAREAKRSSYPDVPLILLLSIFLGIALPSIVLLIISIVDNKIRTKGDIESGCNIPILGIIPQKSKAQRKLEVIVRECSRDSISESFRVIRSNLDFYTSAQSGRATVLQLTSTISGEGKTYTAINLSLSYAYSNKRTLLLDLDLRRGKLSCLLDKGKRDKSSGLSAYLRGRCDDMQSIIAHSPLSENLDYIRVGALPSNAVNLLTSSRFGELIEHLKGCYDYIIIDSAPYFAVADSQIINSIADITLWVIRSGVVEKRLLRELEDLHSAHRISNMTLLLTDADISNRHYGYGYGYGQDEEVEE